MRVVIDGIVFENAHQRGVQRYVRELINHLPAGVEPGLFLTGRARAELPTRGRRSRVLPAPLRGVRTLLRGARRRLERAGDVFHSSYFTLPCADIPSVVTVHDMIVERFIEFYNSRWADEEVLRKRAAIESGDVLIAGSQATAAELHAFYPHRADRVVVVYYGADHIPEAPPEAPSASAAPYALVIGDRGGYKNFRCVLEAMATPSWPRGLSLRIAGPEPRENERMLTERIAGSGRARFLGRIEDAELARLYREAAATIVPSFVEGFGFPVIEAQRAACPVVCSDIPVFHEIAGDSALYFDPHRPDLLAASLARALEGSEAARLRAAGLANARPFTWDRCARMTVAAYQRAIDARGISAPPRPVPA